MNKNKNSVTTEDDSAKALTDDLQALVAELGRQKDFYLRLAAHFDNFRRRTAQDADRRAAAQEEAFIRELLPIIDNLERALASGSSTSRKQIREGVQMTLEQL